jgi:hypothetical protein
MSSHKGFLTFLAESYLQYRMNQEEEEMTAKKAVPAPGKKQWWNGLLPNAGSAIFTLLVATSLLWAQSAGAIMLGAPTSAGTSTGTVAYQGRLANTGGAPLTGTYTMIFRLYAASAGGVPLWTEQWTGANSVQVSDGLFNVMLGSLTPIPQAVMTGNSNLFLGITVGTDSEMAPRVQLGSVPFAVQALTVPDGSITAAKLAPSVSLIPPDGSITPSKLASNFFVYQMTKQITNIPVTGSRPNYSFTLNNVTFPEPFTHKTVSVSAWLNVPGTYLGVPIAQPWEWNAAGFSINSQFYCNCDISSASLSYTAVGY